MKWYEIRVVKFTNGKFAIQRRNPIDRLFNLKGKFMDLITPKLWWRINSNFLKDCISPDKDFVLAKYKDYVYKIETEIETT